MNFFDIFSGPDIDISYLEQIQNLKREEPYMFRDEINTITMPEEEVCFIRIKHLNKIEEMLSRDDDVKQELYDSVHAEKLKQIQYYLDLLREQSEDQNPES